MASSWLSLGFADRSPYGLFCFKWQTCSLIRIALINSFHMSSNQMGMVFGHHPEWIQPSDLVEGHIVFHYQPCESFNLPIECGFSVLHLRYTSLVFLGSVFFSWFRDPLESFMWAFALSSSRNQNLWTTDGFFQGGTEGLCGTVAQGLLYSLQWCVVTEV